MQNIFNMFSAGLFGCVAHCGQNVKPTTQSVATSSLYIIQGTNTGQGTWQCGLPAKINDVEKMSVLELKALKRMNHTTHDDHHHN